MVNIVSYRGLGKAGGLSSSIGQVWNRFTSIGDSWWHMDANKFQFALHGFPKITSVTDISQKLVEDHYNYCNEFLWPIMHDLEQYANYVSEQHQQYVKFNQILANYLSRIMRKGSTPFFIHDYQFGILPKLLAQSSNVPIAVFWHIPWPKRIVNKTHILPMIDIAEGLLGAQTVGFHTDEYAQNFMRFVEKYFPEYKCDWQNMIIESRHNLLSNRQIKVVAAPVGVDFNIWASHPDKAIKVISDQVLDQMPFVLSVDRGDYTKGVFNRLQAINYFFLRFPEWRDKVRFIQICGKTRPGIKAFDQYWAECQRLANKINQDWGTKDWQPLIWIQDSLSSMELAHLYRKAAVMLVSPLRDGLNLIAKEYIACQAHNDNPGALILSAGAGAWHELSDSCIQTNPQLPEQMANAINSALLLDPSEKIKYMNMLSKQVKNNDLMKWWHTFYNELETKQPQETALSKLPYALEAAMPLSRW